MFGWLRWLLSKNYRHKRRMRKKIRKELGSAETGGILKPAKPETTGSKPSKRKPKKKKQFRRYHPPKPRKQKRGR